MRENLRAVVSVLRLGLRGEWPRAVASVVSTLVTMAAQPLTALVLKGVTDAATDGRMGEARQAAILLAALLGAWALVGWASFTLRMGLRERSGGVIEAELALMTGSLHGLEHHERPDYLDEMSLLQRQQQQLTGVPDAVAMNAALLLQLGLTVALLATIHPALLLLVVAVVPSVWLNGRAERASQHLNEELVPFWRREYFLFTRPGQADVGREIRIFGLGPAMERLLDEAEGEMEARTRRVAVRSAAEKAFGWLIFGSAFVITLLYVAGQAARAQATAGDLVMALTLAAQLNTNAAGLVNTVTWGMRTASTARRFLWLSDYADSQARLAHPRDAARAPLVLHSGLEFTDVSFRYPGTDVDVLRVVNLRLPAGSTVAIVGDNGAGKTTLVKLLCRFYDPTEGAITVDGVDLRSIDVDEWRTRLSGGFQDFARFEFVASETVGVGDIPHIEDLVAVTGALERAHAADIPDSLTAGLATQLGRSFDGGVELSGGQWQKLALGRAMMREDPLLLVLDEPTAALDAQTEHALFERYTQAAARSAGRSGAVTVLVSHRFSTVRMADLIVVVHDGTVAEVGTHHDLMALGGLYGELYELQAREYRD